MRGKCIGDHRGDGQGGRHPEVGCRKQEVGGEGGSQQAGLPVETADVLNITSPF